MIYITEILAAIRQTNFCSISPFFNVGLSLKLQNWVGGNVVLKLVIMLLPAVLFWPIQGETADLQGQASVIDGDTIEIHGQRVRLQGIDAPESRQNCYDKSGKPWRCGKQAAFALDDFIGSHTVGCESLGTDRYGRVIARCHVGEQDVEAWLVENGWAMAYRKYSTDYVEHEEQA